MKWLTGATILVCAIVVGCSGGPGEPEPARRTTVHATEVATPDDPTVSAGEDSAAEPDTRTVPPDPTTGETTAGRRGVPGSPIRYDNTLLGAAPEIARQTIEGQLADQCGPGRCGVEVVLRPRGAEGCISEISPMPVEPGGTVTVYHGPDCAEQRGLPPSGSLGATSDPPSGTSDPSSEETTTGGG